MPGCPGRVFVCAEHDELIAGNGLWGCARISARPLRAGWSPADPDTVLRYTEAEWRAFVLGARDGEFDLS
ncbi:DUF397 domain-containing protein [Streptomyces melanosporofaciens]